MTTNNKTKLVTELVKGDLIDPPAGEKKWLWRDGTKRRYLVQSVELGKVTKKGQFIKVKAKVKSPYGDGSLSDIDCQMIETKRIKIHN